jgi:hypothetical protein
VRSSGMVRIATGSPQQRRRSLDPMLRMRFRAPPKISRLGTANGGSLELAISAERIKTYHGPGTLKTSHVLAGTRSDSCQARNLREDNNATRPKATKS